MKKLSALVLSLFVVGSLHAYGDATPAAPSDENAAQEGVKKDEKKDESAKS